MTFLELVQRLHQEAGMSGTSPTTVLTPVGETKRAVAWILSAYDSIQNERKGWAFLIDDFSFATIGAQQEYDPTDATIITDQDLSSWVLESVKVYSAAADENFLGYATWRDFNDLYKISSFRTSTGRPSVFSITPAKKMALWPIPDAVYTVNGQYRKKVGTMTLDASEPIFPGEYHMAIVWRALMLYAGYEEAQTVYAHASGEYNKLMVAMRRDQLPPICWGRTLA